MMTGGHKPRPQDVQSVTPIAPRLLDLDAAATYLGVSPWTVRDLEAAGVLKRVRMPPFLPPFLPPFHPSATA